MREIRINIHQPENVVVVNEKNQKNVSMVNNIFMKSETKRNEPDVDIITTLGQSFLVTKGLEKVSQLE